jgi:diguanylate cyclase (GGDEF)-like protein/PAS domain S-box-containing protein
MHETARGYMVGSGGSVHSDALVRLDAAGALLQCVVDSVADLIFVKDRKGRFVLTNRALAEGCGLMPGDRTIDKFDSALTDIYESADQKVISSRKALAVEEIIPIRGEDRIFQTLKVPWLVGTEVKGIVGVSRDITERKHAEAALKESESLNRSIVAASADCIKLLDPSGQLLFINQAGLCAMEVEDETDLIGKPWFALWPAQAKERLEAALSASRSGQVYRFSAECPTAKGTRKWWDVVVSPVLGDDGKPVKVVSISRDITQQKATEDKVRWGATHDSLTRLPNRVLFHERLARALDAAEAAGTHVGLLHLDLDHFKQINDTLGHDAGDVLLKTFADRLQAAVRASDCVARLGGDEFAVVLPDLACDRDVSDVVEGILSRMREPFVYRDRILDCRVTIGASMYPAHGTTPEDLLKNADIALYVGKTAGRGGMMVFKSEMRSGLQRRSSMIDLARDAVRDERIVPFYQPKVKLASGAVAGFEALLRWRNLRGGIQSPASISAAFDDADVAAAISDRMVCLTVADMRRWLDFGVAFGHVAVNAAAAEFRADNFAERVLEELQRAAVPTQYFQLEVTETVFLGRGAEYVERALKLLSSEGVTIALDDFGTGYASLRHLKQFPVDVIKIDQNFVRNLNEDAGDAAIVDAVINLGKSLGIATVAEGVETLTQADYLLRAGCDYGQGHLFSKAIPASRVGALIAHRLLRDAVNQAVA